MKSIKAIAIIAATVFAAACSKQDVNEGAGKFSIRMTDAPGDYAELFVEIEQVDVQMEGEGWVTLSNESQVVSVLDLTNGAEVEIASATNAEAGVYTAVALHIGANSTLILNTESGGGEFGLQGENIVIVEINEAVGTEGEATVLLDFNVSESISSDGNGGYQMDPVIQPIEDEFTGIQGHVEGEALAAITIESGGESFTTFTNSEGEFLIRGMAEGSYEMNIVSTAQASAGLPGVDLSFTAESSTTIGGVVVTEGSITQVGSISLQ